MKPTTIFLALALAAARLSAQDPSPTPAPEASPAPGPEATPMASPEATPESSPAAPSPLDPASAASESAPPQEIIDPAAAASAMNAAAEAARSAEEAAQSPVPQDDIIPLPPGAGPPETPMVGESEVPAAPIEPLPDSSFADPDAVIPGSIPGQPAAPSGPSPEEIARKAKIRYQEVRAKIENDPAVATLKDKAAKARTSEDERAALREYYRLLFKKIVKEDKSLADHCKRLEQAYLSRLAQARIEPTIPLNPPPSPSPLAD